MNLCKNVALDETLFVDTPNYAKYNKHNQGNYRKINEKADDEMDFAKRFGGGSSNILTELEMERQRMIAQGREVINLSVGTPDLPPDKSVMAALLRESMDPENYKYALGDLPVLLDAVIGWYDRRYGVKLERENITSVYGSQEGLAHIAFPICDPGDIVLVCDPGYPVFSFGPFMAGAQLITMPLTAENNYLIDFDSISPAAARRAKMMVVSYPNNPLTATANFEFYERLVHFAKTYDIIVVHDNAYSELVYEGQPGISFLSVPGAMDVGIEFNSLSKSYNLTGMRISFAIGNAEVIRRFKAFRSQIDYGIFPAVQKTAAAVLNGPQDILERNRDTYRRRSALLSQSLREAGWQVPDCHATMFTWYPLPGGRTDSAAFAMELLEKAGVLCVPGVGFGKMGEGYVRMALVQPEETLARAAKLIGESGIL